MSLLKRLWLLNNAFRHLDQKYFDLVKSCLFRYLKFRLYKFNDPTCIFFELLGLVYFWVDLVNTLAFEKGLQSSEKGLRLLLLALELHIIRDEMLDPPPHLFGSRKSIYFLWYHFL
jgi:hypothetical protein